MLHFLFASDASGPVRTRSFQQALHKAFFPAGPVASSNDGWLLEHLIPVPVLLLPRSSHIAAIQITCTTNKVLGWFWSISRRSGFPKWTPWKWSPTSDGDMPGADATCAHRPAGLVGDVQQHGDISSQAQGKDLWWELMLPYHPAANSVNRWLSPLCWQLPEPL